MTHISISMMPRGSESMRTRLADRMQSFLAGELGIENRQVSVSIHGNGVPAEMLFIPTNG
jgi:hypothetical protein